MSSARAPPNRRFSSCSMNPQPGEIWLADLGHAVKTLRVFVVSQRDLRLPFLDVMVWLKDALAFALDLQKLSE